MIARRTDSHRTRAGRISRQHAANRRDRGVRRVRREILSAFTQHTIQVIEHDPRLNSHGIGTDLLNLRQMPRAIHDQPTSERTTRDAGTGPAGNQRNLLLGRVLRETDDVVTVLRKRDAQRFHLIPTGIAGKHRDRKRVHGQFARKHARQVFDNALPLLVHGIENDFEISLRPASVL